MDYFLKTILFICLFSSKLLASPALMEGALIRDAEIEDVLESYLIPLFEVAKLDPKSLHLYIIHSKDVNAFAMGGGRIGIHSALIIKAHSADEVIGVLAHETAHLAGNHVIRGADAYEKALLQTLIGTIGGIAIGVINPEAGAGILMGAQEVAMRGLLKFSRTQEGAADQGAARFLDSLGYSSRGLLEFMQALRKEDFISEQNIDPYALTHPLPSERIDFFQEHLSHSPHAQASLPSPFEENFKRIQVKLAAFTQSPAKILDRFKPTDRSILARYGRAIAYFQSAQIDESLKEISSLLAEFPKDAFFWDLKGQILFESGKIQDAIIAYENAVKLRPDIPLLRSNLAHAFIESNDEKNIESAFSELLRAKTEEPDNPFIHRLLAVYYGKRGKTGLAALSLAEMAFEVGDLDQAEQQLKRSIQLLKNDPKNQSRAKELLEDVKKLKKQSSTFGI
jgi:predicted Zn-dependent protease